MLTKFAKLFNTKILLVILFVFTMSPVTLDAKNKKSDDVSQEVIDSTENAEEMLAFDGTTDDSDSSKKKSEGKKVKIDSDFFLRLIFDLVLLSLIIGVIYYPNYKKMDTIFTFVSFNILIFLLTFIMNTVKISMGAAFGLFAVFSMLRYRTSGIHIKDMTYLFIFIALGLITSIPMELYELSIIGAIIFVTTLVLDTKLILKKESTKTIRWEDITLIQPENEEELIKDLKARTGLNIHRISIEQVDYLKDTCIIHLYYFE